MIDIRLLNKVSTELDRAKTKHPSFPSDPIHMTSIMMEEAGESVQAANDIVFSGSNNDHLKAELVQTAAMCFRCLERLEGLT